MLNCHAAGRIVGMGGVTKREGGDAAVRCNTIHSRDTDTDAGRPHARAILDYDSPIHAAIERRGTESFSFGKALSL